MMLSPLHPGVHLSRSGSQDGPWIGPREFWRAYGFRSLCRGRTESFNIMIEGSCSGSLAARIFGSRSGGDPETKPYLTSRSSPWLRGMV
jgi:hypothetical protein